MDDTNKKEPLEEVKNGLKLKIELADEDAEKVTGGGSFGFYDREKRKPK